MELASRGVHVALTARDAAARQARVWVATEDQAADIADPLVELLSAYVPEQLLKKAVVNAIRLGIAVGKYVTDHVALRNEVSPRPNRARVVDAAPAAQQEAAS